MDIFEAGANDADDPKPVEKKPEPVAEPAKPVAAKDEKAPKAEKPIKVRKPAPAAEETAPPVPKASDLQPKPQAEVAPVATAPKPVEDDAAFEKDLFEEEKALLDDARAAEKFLSEKYKGQGAKTLNFLKDAAKKEKELDAEDFKSWYEQNRPKISALDFRQIERARVKEEVTREVEPKLVEERHARWVEAETPKIEAKAAEIKRELWSKSLPDEVLQAAEARTKDMPEGPEKQAALAEVRKDYAMELEVTEAITEAARGDIQEFHRLMAINPATGLPLKKRNFDLNTEEGQTHDRIAKMAHGICEEFKANGGTELKRDGKWYATWQEWAKMSPDQQKGWWTFDNNELIQRAQSNVKQAVAAQIKQRKDYLEQRGFKRSIAAPAAAAPLAPQVGAPPAPRISPPPSGNTPTMTPGQAQARALAARLESVPNEV